MKPAFVFVDLLEDFFLQPPLSCRRASLVRAVNDLARFAGEIAAPVIWVRQEFAPDLSDAFLSMKQTGRRVTMAGTKGCRLLAEFEQTPGQHEIVKKRYSAFFKTELEALLESNACTHVVIGGVNSHACVRMTAIDAYQRDYPVLLAGEAIASYDEEFHRESMRYLEQSIGRVLGNAQLKQWLSKAACQQETG